MYGQQQFALAAFTLFCIFSTASAVKGATSQSIKRHPWHVAILKPYAFICSGSLISDNYVLTAAQCVNVLSGEFRVRYGTSVWSDCNDPGARTVDVASWAVHPMYPTGTNVADFNIAVLLLQSSVRISDIVKPIKLRLTKPDPGEIATICGYGFTEEMKASPNLRGANTTILSNTDCHFRFRESLLGGNVQSINMVCAYRKNTGVCSQDVGSPVIVDGLQVGIVTMFAKYCSEDDLPDGYTRVDVYKHFIDLLSYGKATWVDSKSSKNSRYLG